MRKASIVQVSNCHFYFDSCLENKLNIIYMYTNCVLYQLYASEKCSFYSICFCDMYISLLQSVIFLFLNRTLKHCFIMQAYKEPINVYLCYL